MEDLEGTSESKSPESPQFFFSLRDALRRSAFAADVSPAPVVLEVQVLESVREVDGPQAVGTHNDPQKRYGLVEDRAPTTLWRI